MCRSLLSLYEPLWCLATLLLDPCPPWEVRYSTPALQQVVYLIFLGVGGHDFRYKTNDFSTRECWSGICMKGTCRWPVV
jgi:hypothetical protein